MALQKITTNDGTSGVANVAQSQLTTNVATIYTTAAHGFLVGEMITVKGCQGPQSGYGPQGSAYNGTFQITTIPADPSGVQFTYASTHANLVLAGEPTGAQGTVKGFVSPLPAATGEITLTAPQGANTLWVLGETQDVVLRQVAGQTFQTVLIKSGTWKDIPCRELDTFVLYRASSTVLDFYFARALI